MHPENPYGIGTGPVWLTNLNCTGFEEQLLDCPVIIDHIFYCSGHGDDVVQCTGNECSVHCQNN